MPQLLPHLLLICDQSEQCPAAAVLRYGGYTVTKMSDAASARRLAEKRVADAIIIQLPVLKAIRATAELGGDATMLPILAITGFADMLRQSAGHVATISPHLVADEIISKVDLMLARWPAESTRHERRLRAAV